LQDGNGMGDPHLGVCNIVAGVGLLQTVVRIGDRAEPIEAVGQRCNVNILAGVGVVVLIPPTNRQAKDPIGIRTVARVVDYRRGGVRHSAHHVVLRHAKVHLWARRYQDPDRTVYVRVQPERGQCETVVRRGTQYIGIGMGTSMTGVSPELPRV
jgi:hypothetical protein